MGGKGNAIVGAAEQAVAFGFLKDGGERCENGCGEGAGEVGGGEAVVGAEAEEQGLFEDGLFGEAVDGGDAGGGRSVASGENGESWWWSDGVG